MHSLSSKELLSLANDHQQPRVGQEVQASTMPKQPARQHANTACKNTKEQPIITSINPESIKEAIKHSKTSTSDVSQEDFLSLERPQGSGDEESCAEYRLAITEARLKSPQGNEAFATKQLAITENQLRDSQAATAETLANSNRLIESIENKYASELSDLRKQLQYAESDAAEQRQNFQDAQGQIFSMQPRRIDITEEEAVEGYGSLCVNVEHWIDSHLENVLDLDCKLFSKSKVDSGSGSRLLGLIEMTPGGTEARDVVDTLPYYLRNAIMNFIHREIFERELYHEDSEPWKLLHTIETSIRSLEPRRDQATIRAWRSETLTALIAIPEYKYDRRLRATKLAGNLRGCLQVLLPQASKDQLEVVKKSLYIDLIMPAMKLSERFHLSRKLFSLTSRGLDDNRANITQELEMYDCRNLLENGKAVKVLPPGVDCEYVIDICPGLDCKSINGDLVSAPKILKKAQILVAVTRQDRSYSLQGDTALVSIYRSVQDHKKQKKWG